MQKKYYYFYDLIDRYPAKIANKIRELDPNSSFIFIYSEKYNEDVPKKTPKGSKSYFIPSLSKRVIMKLIKNYPPYSFTTIAQRIPDMWMLSLFNHFNIKTNILQHGLWSDKLVRISLFSLLIQKFSKFVHYISYTLKISKLNNLPLLPILYDLYEFLLKENKTIIETKYLNSEKIRANIVFAFDETWEHYYTKKYGYNKEQLIYVGNPDLLLLKNVDLSKKEASICYLCQSLVEDGRLEKDNYMYFLSKMVSFLPSSQKLYIKLHPRSRMNNYLSIKDKENVIFTNDLPVCDFYIGHYTGLLATAKYISNNILIWLFSDHHTPEYFKKFGSTVTNNYKELNNFMNGKIEAKNNLDQFSTTNFQNFDPINKIATNLLVD